MGGKQKRENCDGRHGRDRSYRATCLSEQDLEETVDQPYDGETAKNCEQPRSLASWSLSLDYAPSALRSG